MKAEDVYEALAGLSEPELRQVEARVRLLLGASPDPEAEGARDLELVRSVFGREAQRLGLRVPGSALRVGRASKALEKHARRLVDYAREAHAGPIDQRQLRTFLTFMIRTYFEARRRFDTDLHVIGLCEGLGWVMHSIDQAFPGYFRSHLLPGVAKEYLAACG